MPTRPHATPIRHPVIVKTGTPIADRSPMPELSMVTLSAPVELDDGRVLAAGAEGAIVAVWADGEAYMGEFVAPFHAVVTVSAATLLRAPADG